MRIAHNITALNAWRNLSQISESMGKSVQRISSGYRINTAGDDPAGLVISESLRAQVLGMDQAMANTQDDISMIQTAEGALSEIHSLLGSMRSLALHAANTAAITADAVAADQEQLDSAIASISRIATTTAYAGKKLVDGTAGMQAQVKDATLVDSVQMGDTVPEGAEGNATYVHIHITTAATQATVGQNVGAIFVNDGTQTLGSAGVVSAGETIELNINGTEVVLSGGDTVEEARARIDEAMIDAGKDVRAYYDAYSLSASATTVASAAFAIDVSNVKFDDARSATIDVVITQEATTAQIGSGVGMNNSGTATLSGAIGLTSGSTQVFTLDGIDVTLSGDMTVGSAVGLLSTAWSSVVIEYSGTNALGRITIRDDVYGETLQLGNDKFGLIVAATSASTSGTGDDVSGYISWTDASAVVVSSLGVGSGLALSFTGGVTSAANDMSGLVLTMNSGASYSAATYTDGLHLDVLGGLYLEHLEYGDDYVIDLRDMNDVIAPDDVTWDRGSNIGGKFLWSAAGWSGVSATGSAAATGEGLLLLGDVGTSLEDFRLTLTQAGNVIGQINDKARIYGDALVFHIGGNAGETYRTTLNSMKTDALGTDTHASGLNALLAGAAYALNTDADSAITLIDEAISDVSMERAKLGAVQSNVLESNYRNLGVARENLQASEGRIRDVDMAKEMMEFTKNQVLTQAATAMLAQANTLPQMVLALIR